MVRRGARTIADEGRGAGGGSGTAEPGEENLARLLSAALEGVARAEPPPDPDLPRRLLEAAHLRQGTAQAGTPALGRRDAAATAFPDGLLVLLLAEVAAVAAVGLVASPASWGPAAGLPVMAAWAALLANLAAAPLAAGLIVWRKRRMARV